MSDRITTPYGSWKSPITSDAIVSETIALREPILDGDVVYWIEHRPAEDGRYVLVRRTGDGETTDMTPPGMNARTRVHEYGGGACTIAKGEVYFANFRDQRIYRTRDGLTAEAVTAEGVDMRFADGIHDAARDRLICVREDHTTGARQAVNTLVAVSTADGRQTVLVSGSDFYSDPRLSPCGTKLAYLAWDHPNMPWDGTCLYVADIDADGMPGDAALVAGGPDESICQPRWSPDGQLYFVSDCDEWWNLYRAREGSAEAVCTKDAEFAAPAWQFRTSTYDFVSAEKILCTWTRRGRWHLGMLSTSTGELDERDTPYRHVAWLQTSGERAVFVGGSPTEPTALVELDLATGRTDVLRRSTSLVIDAGHLSVPEAIEFPTEGGRTAHALYYPPKNRDYAAPADERPPLIVHSHGGPTGAASAALKLPTQYWTSRGFAVVDVNYGGSTGYGRAYRRRLRGNWGVVDVDDCTNAALHLVRRGLADEKRLAIAGGSAGGYTTLCALTFRDVFSAGASYFGVSDCSALAEETHKFESRYLDGLIGPYPAEAELYRRRSPIHFTDRLSCPVIFFQGLEDRIVPPNQAELMVRAIREKGVPVAYVAFEGEQHGFRKADTIKRALDGELYFLSRVFAFQPADDIEPITIENL